MALSIILTIFLLPLALLLTLLFVMSFLMTGVHFIRLLFVWVMAPVSWIILAWAWGLV